MPLAAQVGHQSLGDPGVVVQHKHAHCRIVRAAVAGMLRGSTSA
jgi:hypothetical protein